MHLIEHDAKELFRAAGLPAPEGVLFASGAVDPVRVPFPPPWCVKAQVAAGGRGKAGGIAFAHTSAELGQTAERIFALRIKDEAVPFVRVEPKTGIARELYLSLAVSRARGRVCLTVGREGGVDVESAPPGSLLTLDLPAPDSLPPRLVRRAFFHLDLGKELLAPFSRLLGGLHALFAAKRLLLAEINPLALTPGGELVVLDGKVEADDSFLSEDLASMRRPQLSTPAERLARENGFSYVPLPGWVGLMVNGAGLAMAGMDALNQAGLPAADFLDLGGGADEAGLRAAFSLLFGDERVRAVFMNLYGGILSCERVARAMASALNGKPPAKPVVVRMAGNGAEAGTALLGDLGLENIHLARDMDQALSILAGMAPKDAAVTLPPRVSAPQGSAPTPSPVSAPAPFPGRDTQVLIQGVTGAQGRLHTRLMLDYGTKVVAGVTPFKGGDEVEGVPVYDTVAQAAEAHPIGASIIFVPAAFAPDAVLEAADAGIPWIVCVTEHIPQHESLKMLAALRGSGSRLIGPNTPGYLAPGLTKIGIMPPDPFTPGPVAVLSRSGTLTYETCARLTASGIGQTMALGIGGDPFVGTAFTDALEMLKNHADTRAVVLLGEIGGDAEEKAARYILDTNYPKPVSAFIAGLTAPPGKRLGHAGAILEPGHGPEGKLNALAEAGVAVAKSLAELPALAERSLRETP